MSTKTFVDGGQNRSRASVLVFLLPLDRDLGHRDGRRRPILAIGLRLTDLLDNVDAFGDDAKDRVLAIEMRRRAERDEELAAVGIRAGVRHGQNPRAIVPKAGMELVFELVAGPAVALTERVTALDHEALDDAMKDDAVEVRLLLLLARLRVLPFL